MSQQISVHIAVVGIDIVTVRMSLEAPRRG